MKKKLSALSLFAVLILCVQSSLAQNYKGTPKKTAQEYGPFNLAKLPPTRSTLPPVSGTCGNPAGHCLFYGGDFLLDPVGPNIANALANENTTAVTGSPYGAATWVPFAVPAGQTWAVNGLFSNNMMTYGVLDQSPNQPTAAAYWAIQEGIEPGIAGTTIASGTNAATSISTGRSAFLLNEYTIEVKGISVTLSSGTYWLAVVPFCTNSLNPYCDGVSFLSDVEYINTRATNAVGSEPQDSAYFDSSFFGLSYNPTNGPLGACAGVGCDSFSAGVIGHLLSGSN